jgi:hypothetical protein
MAATRLRHGRAVAALDVRSDEFSNAIGDALNPAF